MIFKIISSLNKILRKILVGNFRQEKISFHISKAIIEINKKKNIKILDFGSGFFKPSLAQITSENLKKNNLVSDFVCLDFYTKDDIRSLNTDDNIRYVNLNDLKKLNYKFDFCIISDTLHHIDDGVENLDNLSKVLNELKKNSDLLIMKDHFEYNFLSRKLLQILDFFGNYQNKTNLPKRYFTKTLFNELVDKSNLKIVKSIEDKKYYPWFFLFFSNPKLHFISILKKNDS